MEVSWCWLLASRYPMRIMDYLLPGFILLSFKWTNTYYISFKLCFNPYIVNPLAHSRDSGQILSDSMLYTCMCFAIPLDTNFTSYLISIPL